MEILINRKHHSPWGIDGECIINGRKICDTVEHPTAFRPPGEYRITKNSFSRYFMRGNGPMKSIKGEISLGVYQLQGLVLKAAEMHKKVYQRVQLALKRGEHVELKIRDLYTS